MAGWWRTFFLLQNNVENLLLTNCLTFLSEVCQNLVITLNISHPPPPPLREFGKLYRPFLENIIYFI